MARGGSHCLVYAHLPVYTNPVESVVLPAGLGLTANLYGRLVTATCLVQCLISEAVTQKGRVVKWLKC